MAVSISLLLLLTNLYKFLDSYKITYNHKITFEVVLLTKIFIFL